MDKSKRTIVNKKSAVTAKKRNEAEVLLVPSNLVKVLLTFPEFNLNSEEINVSNFDQLSPLSIEYSISVSSVVDESTKTATKNELERIKEERERIRKEELKKLRDGERSKEEDLLKDDQRKKDQLRLREAEAMRQNNRTINNLRNKEKEYIDEDERRKEILRHQQSLLLSQIESLKNMEILRLQDKSVEEEKSRHLHNSNLAQKIYENQSTVEDIKKNEEKNLRDHQLSTENNNLKIDGKEREELTIREKEKRNENNLLDEEHKRKENEILREEVKKKVEERLKDEDKSKEEDRIKNNERITENNRLKDDNINESNSKQKEDYLSREEEKLKNQQRDSEDEIINNNEKKKEYNNLIKEHFTNQENNLKDDSALRQFAELKKDGETKDDEFVREYIKRKEREMHNQELLQISRDWVLETKAGIDKDLEREEEMKREWEKNLEENRQLNEDRKNNQERLKEEGKKEEEDLQTKREKDNVLSNINEEKKRIEKDYTIDDQKQNALERLKNEEMKVIQENFKSDFQNAHTDTTVREERFKELERSKIEENERCQNRLMEDEKTRENARSRGNYKEEDIERSITDLRNKEIRRVIDEMDRYNQIMRREEKERATERLKTDIRELNNNSYLINEREKAKDSCVKEIGENEYMNLRKNGQTLGEDNVKKDYFEKEEQLILEEERRRELERSRDRSAEKEKFIEDEIERIKEKLIEEFKLREKNQRELDEKRLEEERLLLQERLREEQRIEDQERLEEEERVKENERIKEENRMKEYYRLKEEERKREEERKKDEKMIELLKDVDDEEYDEDFMRLLKSRRRRRNHNFNDPKYRIYLKGDEESKDKTDKLWNYMDTYFKRDAPTIEKEIIRKIELNLGRNRFKINRSSVYYGVALTVKERLQEMWNDYKMLVETGQPKTVNYISVEFMMGRLLKTNLSNLDIEIQYKNALINLGFKLEDLYELENDHDLGKSGLGKTSSCFLDSLTSLNIPAYGYGIRYDHGDFQQRIENNQQKEFSQYMLLNGNPFEIPRHDIKYTVKFYGQMKLVERDGKTICTWENTQDVIAVAYDTIVTGWETYNVNTLRLWKSFPIEHFNYERFHNLNYQESIIEKNATSHLTSFMYPSEYPINGKEFKLMQHFFLISATIQDIVKRFIEMNLPWSEFPKKNAIHINDVQPVLAIPELLRILIDDYNMEFNQAIDIVNKSFSYTCHNILQSNMQQWSVEFFGKVLPRHLKLIYLINHYFLNLVREEFPLDMDRHWEMSCIDESHPKQIKLHNFAFISVHTVNGVSKTHTRFLQEKFNYLYDHFPGKVINITSGVNTRRWIHLSYPELSNLLTVHSGSKQWLDNLSVIESIKELSVETNKTLVLSDLRNAKNSAKSRLVKWVKTNLNIDISIDFMFDIHLKNIHENTRQLMNILYCVDRYFMIKSMSEVSKKDVVKRVTFFSGKADQTDTESKKILQLIIQISNVINSDIETNDFFKVVFIPDYKTSLAELMIPASDLFQSISTPGTEDCSTNNIKAAMTGALLLASRDGSNFEIGQEIGKSNIFFFGKRFYEAEKIRNDNILSILDNRFNTVIGLLLEEKCGNIDFIKENISALNNGDDFYLISHDYQDYALSQELVDKTYKDNESWQMKSFTSICSMFRFSSDNVIDHYSKKVWNVLPFEILEPSSTKDSSNLNDRLVQPDNNVWSRKLKEKNKLIYINNEIVVKTDEIPVPNKVLKNIVIEEAKNPNYVDPYKTNITPERNIIFLPCNAERIEYLPLIRNHEIKINISKNEIKDIETSEPKNLETSNVVLGKAQKNTNNKGKSKLRSEQNNNNENSNANLRNQEIAKKSNEIDVNDNLRKEYSEVITSESKETSAKNKSEISMKENKMNSIVKNIKEPNHLEKETQEKTVIALPETKYSKGNNILKNIKKPLADVNTSANPSHPKPLKKDIDNKKQVVSQTPEVKLENNLPEKPNENLTKEKNESNTVKDDGIERIDENINRKNSNNKRNYNPNESRYYQKNESYYRESPTRKYYNNSNEGYDKNHSKNIYSKDQVTVKESQAQIQTKNANLDQLNKEDNTNQMNIQNNNIKDLIKNSPKKKKFNKRKKKKKKADEGFIISSNLNNDESSDELKSFHDESSSDQIIEFSNNNTNNNSSSKQNERDNQNKEEIKIQENQVKETKKEEKVNHNSKQINQEVKKSESTEEKKISPSQITNLVKESSLTKLAKQLRINSPVIIGMTGGIALLLLVLFMSNYLKED